MTPLDQLGLLFRSRRLQAAALLVAAIVAVGLFWRSGQNPPEKQAKRIAHAKLKKTTRSSDKETSATASASLTVAAETGQTGWGRRWAPRTPPAPVSPPPTLDSFVGAWTVTSSPSIQNLDNNTFYLSRLGDFIIGRSSSTRKTVTLKFNGATLSGWYITNAKVILSATAALAGNNQDITIVVKVPGSADVVYRARRQ